VDDCPNDWITGGFGAALAARRVGVRIPDDLSVVGFDDVDQAAWAAPPLTTVRQQFAQMGATAAGLALSLAAGQEPTQDRYELDTTLVVRGSTGRPPAGPPAVDPTLI